MFCPKKDSSNIKVLNSIKKKKKGGKKEDTNL